MFDSEGRMTLPIRLVPNRSGVIVAAIFALGWVGFMLASLGLHFKDALLAGNYAVFFAERNWSILVFGVIGVVGFFMLGKAILMALPGSPFCYLEISSTGLKRRRFFDEKAVSWGAIEQLNVVDRLQSSGKSKKRHWWVLAETTPWAADEDVDRRIKQALLAYDADELAPLMTSGEEPAKELREALDGLLKMSRAGESVSVLAMPRSLREVAVAVRQTAVPGKSAATKNAPAKMATVQTAPRRKSVIER